MQETHQMVAKQQLETKLNSKERYDQTVTPLTLNVGDKVLVQEKASKGKLALKWLSPYSVVEIHTDSPNVTIMERNKPTRLHRNLLRLFHFCLFQNLHFTYHWTDYNSRRQRTPNKT